MITARVFFARPPGSTEQDYRAARREALEAMLRHWQEEFVPMHFEASAHKRYEYQPRKGSGEGPTLQVTRIDPKTGKTFQKTIRNPHYLWRKKREKGHMRPLSYTGDSERIAKSPANFKIRDGRGGAVKGVITGLPRYFFQYHKGGMVTRRVNGVSETATMARQPDKARELSTIRADELDAMKRVGEQRMQQILTRLRGTGAAA